MSAHDAVSTAVRSRAEVLDALSPAVAVVVAEANAGLVALYGDRLARVVLYGSQARGDARPDSDVDLLVVLHGDVRPYDEIRRTGILALDLLIESNRLVSMYAYSVADFESRTDPFMVNVRQDGIPL